MNTSSMALFLHICGALGMSASSGLEAFGLQQVRRATMPIQAGAGLRVLGGTRKLGFPSMLLVVLTGLFMMVTDGGPTPWLYTTLGAVILLITLTGASGPRISAVGRALSRETEPLSPTFHKAANHALLTVSLYTRIAIILAIVFLKTTQPGWNGSLLTISVAIVISAVSAFSQSRRVQIHAAASS